MINGNCLHPSVRHCFKLYGIPCLSRCIAYRNWKCIYLVLKPSFQHKPCLLLLADNHIDLLQRLWDFSIQQLPAGCRGQCRVKSAKLTLFGKLCIKYTVSATMFFEGLWAVEIKKGQEAIFFLQVFQVNWDSGKVGHIVFSDLYCQNTKFYSRTLNKKFFPIENLQNLK